MLDDLINSANISFPAYLTPAQKDELYSELKKFPTKFNYYLYGHEGKNWMQGDGLFGFIALNFYSGEKKNVSGIIISNSCDINIHNKIPKNRKIIFAPLIKLADYYSFLKSTKKTDEIITNTIDTIKSQRVTDIFYFPEIKGKINESIALLDDLHSMPISEFTPAEKTQLFRLSQSGFYLFLIKLSIHLTRMFEGVARSN